MSFILDALKKSENDRQDSTPAEFTTVSSNGEPAAAPKWLWVLGGLLLLNTIVLAFVLLKPDSPPPVAAAAPPPVTTPAPQPVATPAPQTAEPGLTSAPATTTATDGESFSTRVAEARASRPPPRPATETVSRPEPESVAPRTPPPEPVTTPAAGNVADSGQVFLLPTLTELRADGVNLPEMHLDIHVYSGTADDRFVFINMNKYRERDRTSEGPNVSEITPEGVVLDYQGRKFLLPRE